MINLTIFPNGKFDAKNRIVKQVSFIPGEPVFHYVVPEFPDPDTAVINWTSRGKMISKTVERQEYDTLIPEDGDFIIVVPRVEGGGNGSEKQIGSIIASIALMYLSMGVGNAVTGAAGVTKWTAAAYLAAGATQVAGGLLISKLFSTEEDEADSVYAFGTFQSTRGERNPVPQIYGAVRGAGQIMTEYISTDGKNQWYNVIISGGEGPVDWVGNGQDANCTGISDIQINGQDLKNFDTTNNASKIELYKRSGLNDQSAITRFNEQHSQQFPAYTLINVDATDQTPQRTVTTENEGEALEIILSFPKGLFDTKHSGKKRSFDIKLKIQYRLYGTETWTTYTRQELVEETDSDGNVISSYYVTIDNYLISENTSTPFYRVVRFDNLPTRGLFDVSMQCVYFENDQDDSAFDCIWYALSSITYEDPAYPNLALLALRIPASALIASKPTITAVWNRSEVWIWVPDDPADPDGRGSYVKKPATNPAWACLDVIHMIRQYKNIHTGQWEFVVRGADVRKSDYLAFKNWADYCDAKGYKCNYIHDKTTTLFGALEPFELVGFGRVLIGAKFTCVFEAKVDAPVQLFTPANTLKGTFKKEIQSTSQRATLIEVTYLDSENGYESSTVTVPGVDFDNENVTENPISITLKACTSYNQAYKYGWFKMLENKYIKETISFGADIDAIVCRPGDVIAYQRTNLDDQRSGRVVDAGVNWIKLSKTATMEPGVKYAVRIRLANDVQIEKPVYPTADCAAPTETVTTDTVYVSDPFADDRIAATKSGSTSFKVNGDYTAKFIEGVVIMLDYIYVKKKATVISSTYANNETTVQTVETIPDSLNMVRYDYTMPREGDLFAFGQLNDVVKWYKLQTVTRKQNNQHELTAVEYDAAVFTDVGKIPDATINTTIKTIKFDVTHHYDGNGSPWLDIALFPARNYGGAIVFIDGKQAASLSLNETNTSIAVETFGEYSVKVVTLDFFGNQNLQKSITYKIPEEKVPSDITGLTNFLDSGALYLAWNLLDDSRGIVYEIRKGDTWDTSTVLGRTTDSKYAIPGDGLYWVSGYYRTLYSKNPASIEIEGTSVIRNVLVTSSEAKTGWGGIPVNVEVLNNRLIMSGKGNIYEAPDIYAIPNIYLYGGAEKTGSYQIPEANIVTLEKTASCPVYYTLSSSGGIVTPQIRCATAAGVFGSWQDLVNGRGYVGLQFDFRLVFTNTGNEVIMVNDFTFTVDVPDVIDKGTVLVPAEGLNVTFNRPFQAAPGISIAILNATSGDYYAATNSTKTGFNVVLKDSSDKAISKLISWLAIGF